VSDDDKARQQFFSSFVRARIACNIEDALPTLDELGLGEVRQAAFEWQSNRNNAEFFAFFWHDEAVSGFVREIHGLFGSSAEVVLSSLEAAGEIDLTRRAIAKPNDELNDVTQRVNRAGQWRSLRFFGEAQANNMIVFGHHVANLVLRTLALQPGFKVDGIQDLKDEVFHPESNDRRAWCSLNAQTAGEMRHAASNLQVDCGPLLDSLGNLWSVLAPVWRVRAIQYHRWRGESPGVTGINFRNPIQETAENGIIVRTLHLANEYVEGVNIVEDVVSSANATLRGVGAWMPKFLEVWVAVFEECKRRDASVAKAAWRTNH